MNRKYVTDALKAILEDIFRLRMSIPLDEEFDAFFDPEQFDEFRRLVAQEFELSTDTLIDSCSTFRELVTLLDYEISP